MKTSSLAVVFLLISSMALVGVTFMPNARAAMLYVGGAGPGNYTTIQDAVDFANPGDTIFVFSGTYTEQVSIYKPLTLIGEDRTTTIVDGDMIGNVVLITSDQVMVTGFTLRNGGPNPQDAGVHLTNVQNCTIKDNTISYNLLSGIVLEGSSGNIIEGNTVSDHGWYGIELVTSHGNTIANNTLSVNYQYALALSYSNSNQIIDNTISASEYGIFLALSVGNILHGNQMLDCGFAFYAYWDMVEYYNTQDIGTSNTVNGKPVYYWKDVDGGSIPPGAGQVILANCTNVTVKNQNVSHSTWGITLGFSSNNTIANNTASRGGVGVQIERSRDNLIVNNTANHNSLPGTGTWFGFYLLFSDNNTLTRNTASDNEYGIVFQESNGNFVLNNTVSNNSEGISLWSSTATVVSGNAVSGNNVGVYSDSGVNRIFHNNFTDNSVGAMQNGGGSEWDDGYPSGGNYWSDYDGTDDYSGPNQDQPGSDGIGDTPYYIDIGAQDDYPLMWFPPSPIVWEDLLFGPVHANATRVWSNPPDRPLSSGSASYRDSSGHPLGSMTLMISYVSKRMPSRPISASLTPPPARDAGTAPRS